MRSRSWIGNFWRCAAVSSTLPLRWIASNEETMRAQRPPIRACDYCGTQYAYWLRGNRIAPYECKCIFPMPTAPTGVTTSLRRRFERLPEPRHSCRAGTPNMNASDQTSSVMERKRPHWLTLLIVTAFAVCGGFVAGSLIGVRERGLLKAKGSALAQSEARTQTQLSQAEHKNGELSAELEKARIDVEQWRSECERLEDGVAKGFGQHVSFHPPMVLDADAFEMQTRIVELECEIASLKELVSQNRTVDGPPSSPPSTGISLVKAAETPTAKEQCSALTKKGVRCSRIARSNGKCWQHGG